MKVYIIPGNPIALKRPNFNSLTKKVYNPLSQAILIAGLCIKSQHGNDPLFIGPLHLDVTYYLPLPESTNRKHKQKKGDYHTFVPDLSNLQKFTEDVCIGVCYKDDAIISSVTARKIYDPNPRTEFSFTPLKENPLEKQK